MLNIQGKQCMTMNSTFLDSFGLIARRPASDLFPCPLLATQFPPWPFALLKVATNLATDSLMNPLPKKFEMPVPNLDMFSLY